MEQMKVRDITLLSAEETRRVPRKILNCSYWWWLRSPGSHHDVAAYVFSDGSVDSFGSDVNDEYVCVRPALVVENLNANIGKHIEIGGFSWVAIGDDKVLYDDEIKIVHQFDSKSNVYETSEIRQFLYRFARRFGIIEVDWER